MTGTSRIVYYRGTTISMGQLEAAPAEKCEDGFVMKLLRQVAEEYSRWMTCVATTIMAMRDRFASARPIELVEETGGEFSVRSTRKDPAVHAEAGRIRIVDGKVVGAVPAGLAAALRESRAQLILQPARFMFRPLDLPRRAAEFLDGIVRSQVDRLTPWSAGEAAFGWSAPIDAGNDRIVVTVAATARVLITPLVEAVAGLGADSIIVSTFATPGTAAPAIKVFERTVRGALELRRVRGALVAVLVAAVLLAGAAVTAEVVVGNDLEARQADVARRIASRRVAMRAGDTTKASALAALERRKHETPSSVIVLEALSQILPDHTYVTELRITEDKMQVVGVTRDAPSLIRLIEQSAQFTRATFFAATTRSPTEPGEHFHIEAHIEPVFTPRT
jgi:general secretion pathway protein L